MVGEGGEASRQNRLQKEIQRFKMTTCSCLTKEHYSAHQEKARALMPCLMSSPLDEGKPKGN